MSSAAPTEVTTLPVHSGSASVIDRGQLPTAAVVARVHKVREIMETLMKEGVHYGRIPTAKKPSLYKPGAELLMLTFQFGPRLEVEDLSTPDGFRYRVKVVGVSQLSGAELGEGIGTASTDEEKYRWRAAVHPKEYERTAENLRRVKFDREGHETMQVRTSPADLDNTVLLMAVKRGTVNMVRVVTGCSDVFDQDLEDLAEELRQQGGDSEPVERKKPQRASETKPAGKGQSAAASKGNHQVSDPVTVKKVKEQPREGKDSIWWVETSDGQSYSTFDKTAANELQSFAGTDHQVRITYDVKTVGTKTYRNYVGVALVEAPPAKPAAAAAPAPATAPSEQPELTSEDLGNFGLNS